MRIAAPLLVLAALAAAPALAQKPGVDDLEREAYRGRGLSLCLVNVAAAEGVSADDAEAICGCAFDRFMPRWPTGALPAIGTSRFQTVMAGDVLSCTAEQRPALAAAVARRLAGAPAPIAEAPPPLVLEEGGKPGEAAEAPAPETPALRAWLDGLSLPRWLAGSDLPVWAWILLAMFAFVFLRGLLRRREERDLDGPPPWMRPGSRPGPPPPRR